MTTLSPTSAQPTSRPGPAPASLRVGVYDKVASLLLALLVLIGLTVSVLLAAWLSSGIHVSQKAVPVTLEEVGGGQGSGVGADGMELEAPDMAEVAKESDLSQSELSETLATVAEAASSLRAEMDSTLLIDPLQQAGGGRSKGTGNQGARGTGGGAGGGSGPGVGVPRGQRWEIRFSEEGSLEEYARQLDHFGIELAVLGPGSDIFYAGNLSKPKPDQRVGRRDDEKRLYMTWRRGALERADRELLQRAGIHAEGKVVLQFFPPEVEQQLVQLERQFRNRDPREIRHTRFGVQAMGQSYQFKVLDQGYF